MTVFYASPSPQGNHLRIRMHFLQIRLGSFSRRIGNGYLDLSRSYCRLRLAFQFVLLLLLLLLLLGC